MTIAHWHNDYCTGDDRIDREHRSLFDMVNDLHHALERSAPLLELRDLLTTMATHTVEHFRHEEALMQDHQYPGYARHKQVHDNLLAKVNSLINRLERGEAVLGSEVTACLTEWLAHHIRGEDQSMIRFFQAQNQTLLQSTLNP
ncbi:bacteriohemerythrin [Leptolyngbya sp. CCY15150]|uniref:bacteriohemerythrin n=1 Tax=Leptolyngbya sp. CCY15150 TaxID=2767772 RepID=UPI00194E7930|nr:bacteriohemerythrin [Leptolyngbya sp. CCY15150]